jgi:hypothetical protein
MHNQRRSTVETTIEVRPVSKGHVWTGRVISILVILFLLMDTAMKFAKPKPVIDGTMHLGYQLSAIPIIGGILLGFTILYIIPQTAVLGAICLTGYLGGAFASQFRINEPVFSQIFPIIFCALAWLGLLLRDRRLRELLPIRR